MVNTIVIGRVVAGLLAVMVYVIGAYLLVRYDLIPAIKRKSTSEVIVLILGFLLIMAGFTCLVGSYVKEIFLVLQNCLA